MSSPSYDTVSQSVTEIVGEAAAASKEKVAPQSVGIGSSKIELHFELGRVGELEADRGLLLLVENLRDYLEWPSPTFSLARLSFLSLVRPHSCKIEE